jgi:hypothetical protein
MAELEYRFLIEKYKNKVHYQQEPFKKGPDLLFSSLLYKYWDEFRSNDLYTSGI